MKSSNPSVTFYLYIFTISIMLIISVITTFNNKSSNQNAGKILALMNWCYFYSAIVTYLNNSGYITSFPHLFRTAHITILLYMPLSYLYIIQFFSPRRFVYKDLLHLLPALLYVIDYFPFFLKSGAEKMSIYHSLAPLHHNISFSEGFFTPPYFHIPFRYAVMAIYWIAQVLFIKKILLATGDTLRKYNPTQVKWMKWLVGSELMIIIPPLGAILTGSFEAALILLQISSLLAAGIQSCFLFSHPEILYEIKGVVIDESKDLPEISDTDLLQKKDSSSSETTVKQPVQYLSESMLDKIQVDLDRYMSNKKPFLQPGFGLIDLAKATGFTPHQVSAYINKRCEMNFYSYINRHRIEYCKQKFDSKEYIDKTLEAISHDSGFQSRATFIRAFKSNTGLTPSEYIKKLKSTTTE